MTQYVKYSVRGTAWPSPRTSSKTFGLNSGAAVLLSPCSRSTLRKDLADHGLVIDESTLYPLLRRLETQGLLVSEWREEEKRNKRFYRLSPEGEQILTHLLQEWQEINASINRIV